MTTLKSLEKNRNFEFLYLCILLIISRMRDDIDKFNENLTRMASNKSIYTGNINSQSSPSRKLEYNLDIKKLKSNNLANTNAYFDQNNINNSKNSNVKSETINNYHSYYNLPKEANGIEIKNTDNNNLVNPRELLNKFSYESSKTLAIGEIRNKEKTFDFSFTNLNQNKTANTNDANFKNESFQILLNSNNSKTNSNNLNNQTVSNHLLNGYININRVTPNINTPLNQFSKVSSIPERSYTQNSQAVTSIEDENIKYLDKNNLKKENFERIGFRNSEILNPVYSTNNKNEKIILGKNQIRDLQIDISNGPKLSQEDLYMKEKERENSNYFNKKFVNNNNLLKKPNRNILLINLRKEKEKDIDRESIFSMKNAKNFDNNKSPVISTNNSCSFYNLHGNKNNLMLINN